MNAGGLHLIIDGSTAVPLTSGRIEGFLRDLPALIGVHPITEPVVVQQEDGWCGLVIIAESHISVHSRGNFAMTDIFSCLGFKTTPVIEAVVRLLGMTTCKAQTLSRPMPPAVRLPS